MGSDFGVFQIESFFVLLLFVLALASAFKNVSSNFKIIKNDSALFGIFLISILAATFFLFERFPGIISTDDKVAIENIPANQVLIWTSYTYGHLLSAFRILGLELGGTVILNFLFYFGLIIKIFNEISKISDRRFKIATAIFTTAALIWPSQLGALIVHNRDSLFAVISGHLFFSFFDWQKKENHSSLVFLILFMLLRVDGALIGFLIFACAAASGNVAKKFKVTATTVIVFALISTQLLSQLQPNWDRMSTQYKLVPYIVTLSAVLNSDQNKISEDQLKVLSEFYKVDEIKRLKDNDWYLSKRGHCLNTENLQSPGFDFYWTLIGLYIENKEIVLEHYKIKTLKTLSSEKRASEALPEGTDINWLKISMLICFIGMLALKEKNILIALFNLRIVILLLLSPDPLSKYLFSSQILAAILIPILMIRAREYFNKSKSEPAT